MSNGAGQANGEPSSKKRKIDGDSATNGSQSFAELAEDRNSTVIFEVKDLSFQVPLRKKMNLEITRNGRPTTKKQLQECTIRARAPNTNTIEYEGANFGKHLAAHRGFIANALAQNTCYDFLCQRRHRKQISLSLYQPPATKFQVTRVLVSLCFSR